MNCHISGQRAFIRLDKDEDIFAELEKLASDNNWQAASVAGIGAVKDLEIGVYYLDEKKYLKKSFPDLAELLSLKGNLSLKDGKPFYHLHGVFCGHDYQCFGGHVFQIKVGVICELVVDFAPDLKIERQMNDEVGLAQWGFCPV